MRAYRFDVERHEEYGTLGLKPKWYPMGEPFGAMAAAHDILEHFPGDDGSIEGELQALGAAVYIRGDGGWQTNNMFRRPFDRVGDPAADLPMVWGRFLQERSVILDAPRVRDADALIDGVSIIDHAMKELRAQYEDQVPSEQTQLEMARWIALGYVRAKRRYRRVIGGACALAGLSMEIEKRCDGALKHAEDGMILIVYVNVMRADCRVDLRYREEYE